MCEENGNRFTFTFTCYSNYEMVFEKKIIPTLNVVREITDKHYMLFDFESLTALHIRANGEFYAGYNGQPIKVSFKSFITTLTDIVDCEIERN
jgi:hypothetical protein